MQGKQRFTNVILVTPTGEKSQDLLVDDGLIVDIVERDAQLDANFQNIDGNDNYIFPGMIDVLQYSPCNNPKIQILKNQNPNIGNVPLGLRVAHQVTFQIVGFVVV